MKISIYDECGSNVSAILTLDGGHAVEKVDFIKWEGKYHKNGRFSYSEGGIALKNGAYAQINRSTHSSANMRISLHVIKDDVQVAQTSVGKVSELDSYPKFEGEYAELFSKLFEAHIATRKPEIVEKWREKWATASSFY